MGSLWRRPGPKYTLITGSGDILVLGLSLITPPSWWRQKKKDIYVSQPRYLRVLSSCLWSHIWIKRLWLHVVSTELLPPVAPLLRLPRTVGRRLPVGGASRQPRRQLVTLRRGRADLRARPGSASIPPQDLDLVAILVRGDAVAAGGGRAATEGDLVASPGRRDVGRGRRGHGLG